MRFAFCLAATVTLSLASQGLEEAALDALVREQSFEARRASSSNPNIHENSDLMRIPVGETLVLMDEDGPGIVTHFWNTISTKDLFPGRTIVLRVFYDGNEAPSVVSPLGDFFGVGHAAEIDFDSEPVSVTSKGRSRVCYWRMPFGDHIKIAVSNDCRSHLFVRVATIELTVSTA